MQAILKSDFFWGVVVGVALTMFGAWVQSRLTVWLMQKAQKKIVVKFCIDEVKNIQGIIKQLDETRTRTKLIAADLLALIDVELGVYARNREHLLHLPESARDNVREFMNQCALRKADVAGRLAQFNELMNRANQVEAAADAPKAQRLRDQANNPLLEAQAAADKLATVGREAPTIIEELSKVRV